jgi:hypothetical protein
MPISSASAATIRILGGVVGGVLLFALLGLAEISSRLHQGGVAQLAGPPRPSWGADITQIITLVLVLVLIAAVVALAVPLAGRAGAVAALATLVVLSLIGWVAFTEPTFVSFGESMAVTADRIIHAGSTSLGTFVTAGVLTAWAVRNPRKGKAS